VVGMDKNSKLSFARALVKGLHFNFFFCPRYHNKKNIDIVEIV